MDFFVLYGDDSYDVFYNILADMNLSRLDIEKAYVLIPLAISHVFIEKINTNILTTEATIINKYEESFIVNLENEPIFAKTHKWAKEKIDIIDKESLMSIFYLSSSFNLFNNALNEGVELDDLYFSGTIISLSNYGIDNQSNNKIVKKKPFWKFW